MVSLVQETLTRDTTGKDSVMATPDDILSLPNAAVQRLQPNDTSTAYTHVENLQYPHNAVDYDTFAVRLEEGVTYRMQLIFEEPSKVIHNKMAHLMDIGSSSWIYNSLILSHSVSEPYQEGNAVYSTSFTASRTADHLISLQTGTMSSAMAPTNVDSMDEIYDLFPQSYAAPYSISVYDVSRGIPKEDDTGVSLELAQSVALLYEAALDREPDIGGLNYWLDTVSEGMSHGDVARSFLSSDEFQANFDVASNGAYIDRLYLNVLDRPADAGGKAYWADAMNAGMSRAQTLIEFADSAENIANAEWLSGLAHTDDGWIL